MRIEKLGTVIYSGTGSAETTIKVTPDQFELNGAARCRAEIEELRDALTAALAEYDAMTPTTEPAEKPAPVSAFHVGQVLTGHEALPVGTVARDGMGDKWHCLAPGRYSMNSDNRDPVWPLSKIIDNYSRATIVSLP